MKRVCLVALTLTLVTSAWPQAPLRTPSGDTRGWKIYRSQKYGVEFRYPPALSAVESGPNTVERRLLAGESISGTQPPILQTIEVKNRSNGIVLTVEIPDQKKFLVVSKDYDWSLRACGEEGFEEIKSKNETLLGRYKMLQVITTGSQFY